MTAHALARGVFTLSLDFELIWGTRDKHGVEAFGHACEVERAVVIDRLLALLAARELSATWCVLGHLFLDRCDPVDGTKHPEIVPPDHEWHPRAWFEDDPCTSEAEDPNFYGRSLVLKLLECPVAQEIGSHSFSHPIFGDGGCSEAAARSELTECVRLAAGLGVEMRSFAFPRNRPGHLRVLREHGFTCYRGPEPTWYEGAPLGARLKRVAHLASVVTAARPPVVLPERTAEGLWNVPGSMIFFPMHGRRRHIPMGLRVKRALRGIDAAARRRRIFHLWFHPTNLADDPDRMFGGLEAMLDRACDLRDRGALDLLPMGAVAQLAERR